MFILSKGLDRVLVLKINELGARVTRGALAEIASEAAAIALHLSLRRGREQSGG
jgi:hypothetical protein